MPEFCNMTFDRAGDARNNFVLSNVSNCKHYNLQYFDEIQIYVHVLFFFLEQERKAAIDILDILCDGTFNVPRYLKEKMVNLVSNIHLSYEKFETMAYAVFLFVYSRWEQQPIAINLLDVAEVASSKAAKEAKAKQTPERRKLDKAKRHRESTPKSGMADWL